jgi:uncharacterized membrane protein
MFFRSLMYKSLLWRFISTVLGFLTILLISGDINFSFLVGAVSVVVQTAAHYSFEVIWAKYSRK